MLCDCLYNWITILKQKGTDLIIFLSNDRICQFTFVIEIIKLKFLQILYMVFVFVMNWNGSSFFKESRYYFHNLFMYQGVLKIMSRDFRFALLFMCFLTPHSTPFSPPYTFFLLHDFRLTTRTKITRKIHDVSCCVLPIAKDHHEAISLWHQWPQNLYYEVVAQHQQPPLHPQTVLH